MWNKIKEIIIDFQNKYNISDEKFSLEIIRMYKNWKLDYDNNVNKEDSFKIHYIINWYIILCKMRKQDYSYENINNVLDNINKKHKLEELDKILGNLSINQTYDHLKHTFDNILIKYSNRYDIHLELKYITHKLLNLVKLDVENMTTKELDTKFRKEFKYIYNTHIYNNIITKELYHNLNKPNNIITNELYHNLNKPNNINITYNINNLLYYSQSYNHLTVSYRNIEIDEGYIADIDNI